MHMRLGFAIAVHVDADVLLLDEVFAVGDEAFQRKCIGKILDFKERGGTRLLRLALRFCGRAALRAGAAAEPRPGRVRRRGLGGDQALPQVARARGEPEEVGAGLREWGTRRGSRRRRPARGRRRRGRGRSFVSGEPVTIRLQLVGERAGAGARALARGARLERVAARCEPAGPRRARLGRLAGRTRASLLIERLPLGGGRVPDQRRAHRRRRDASLPPHRRGGAFRGRAVRRRARSRAPRRRVGAGRREATGGAG